MKPDLSIIIPVYNGGWYSARCLGSILRQQKSSQYEIIVVNDGSTDNTPMVLDRFARKYKNIRVINQQNAGVSVARNNGIAASNGKYVTFADCDDMVGLNESAFDEHLRFSEYCRNIGNMRIQSCKFTAPNLRANMFDNKYFVNLMNAANETNADVVFGGKITINRTGNYTRGHTYTTNYTFGANATDKDMILQHADVRENANFALYRREMLDKHKLRFMPNMQLDEDILFCMLAVLYAENVATAHDATYFYNRHADTLSNITDNSEMMHKYALSNIQRFSVLLNELDAHPEYKTTYNRIMKQFAEKGTKYTEHNDAFPPRMCDRCDTTCCDGCIYAEHMREQARENIKKFMANMCQR